MASARISVNEVRQQELEDNPEEVYSSFSDESEQDISDRHEK